LGAKLKLAKDPKNLPSKIKGQKIVCKGDVQFFLEHALWDSFATKIYSLGAHLQ